MRSDTLHCVYVCVCEGVLGAIFIFPLKQGPDSVLGILDTTKETFVSFPREMEEALSQSFLGAPHV